MNATPLGSALLISLLAPAATPQCREIVTIDADAQEYFGSEVALYGTSLAAPTEFYDVPNGPEDVTAIVLFEKAAGTWTESGALLEPDGMIGDWFGQEYALGSDTILVSTSFSGSVPGQNTPSAVYAYDRSGASWVLSQEITSSAGPLVDFGYALALDGDRFLAGEPGDSPWGNDSGSVAVFERSAGTWSEVQRLDIGYWSPGFLFGAGVALAGDLALVGVVGSGAHADFSGEVRLYERVAGVWTYRQQLTPSWIEEDLEIGDRIALTPNAAFVCGVGGIGQTPANAGIVSVFRPDGGGVWSETQTIQGNPSDLGADFGVVIAARGDLLGVGAPTEVVLPVGDGAAYLYRDGPSGYELLKRYTREDGESFIGGFGAGFGIYGDEVAISHPSLIVGGELQHGGVVVERTPCLDLFQSFCPCVTDDPCVGIGQDGGCQNSTGVGARLGASGTPGTAADDLVLEATDLPPNQPAVLFMGDAFGSTPLGDGLRCATGQTFRYPVSAASGGGVLTSGPGLVAFSQANFAPPGRIDPGEVWNFQVWYRDPAGPCGTGSNLTDAIQVPFLP